MKKSTKIISLILACVFCFSVLTLAVSASDVPNECPNHPSSSVFIYADTASGAHYHYYECSACGYTFGHEFCNYVPISDDCTSGFNCETCGHKLRPDYSSHDFSDVHYYDALLHYYTCSNASYCSERFYDEHTFVNGRCVCGATN